MQHLPRPGQRHRASAGAGDGCRAAAQPTYRPHRHPQALRTRPAPHDCQLSEGIVRTHAEQRSADFGPRGAQGTHQGHAQDLGYAPTALAGRHRTNAAARTGTEGSIASLPAVCPSMRSISQPDMGEESAAEPPPCGGRSTVTDSRTVTTPHWPNTKSEEPGGGVMEAEDLQVLPSRLGGLGLMARRSFRKGEVVLVERPFLTVGELLQRSRNSRTA